MADQPCSRKCEITLQGRHRDPESLGALGFCQAGKEAQFDSACRSLVELLKSFESLVYFEQIFLSWTGKVVETGDRNTHLLSASLRGTPVPCVVDENSPKLLRCDGKEVRASLPCNGLRPEQPEVEFVDQRSRL